MQCDTAGSTLDPGSWGWGTPGCAVPARPCWQQALGSRVGREGNLIPDCQIPQDFQTLQGPQTLQEPCQTSAPFHKKRCWHQVRRQELTWPSHRG